MNDGVDGPTGSLPDGLVRGDDGVVRCWWGPSDPDYARYHDEEWGFPVDDDHRLFEKICLEGFQSGLSWLTILRKRPRFREVFRGFDPAAVARMGERDVERLLGDAGIVRHRGKIESTIRNATRARELVRDHGSLAAYFWSFEPEPDRRPPTMDKATVFAMAKTPESTALSRALKKRGWTYVGPTTCYAFMQAMGLVNDHLEGCAIRPRAAAARARFTRPSG